MVVLHCYVQAKLTDGSSKMTVELIWIMDHGISHQLEKVGNFNFMSAAAVSESGIILCLFPKWLSFKCVQKSLENLRRLYYQKYLMP